MLAALCLVFSLGVYIFIPSTFSISKITTIKCSKNAANRFLFDENQWMKWWPGQSATRAASFPSRRNFQYNKNRYNIQRVFTDKIDVLKINGLDSLHTSINILAQGNYSITLQWECYLPGRTNPFKRLLQYQKAKDIKEDMTAIFQHLQTFLEETSNVYGFPIKEIISKDSTLIATRYITKNYPGTENIYSVIDSMKQYLLSEGAIQTDQPMLRVSKTYDSSYQTMIAIPVNKVLPGNGRFFFQRFVPYKTITGTVKGGIHTVEQAFNQLEIYIYDHHRTSMAVPFQSLVTDRRAENDSLKWITVICQPVS